MLQAAVPGTLPEPLQDTSGAAVFMARAAEAWQALAVRIGSLRWRLQRQVCSDSAHPCSSKSLHEWTSGPFSVSQSRRWNG